VVQGFYSLASTATTFRLYAVAVKHGKVTLSLLAPPVGTGKVDHAAQNLRALQPCKVEAEPKRGDRYVSVAGVARTIFGGGGSVPKLENLLEQQGAELEEGRLKVGGRGQPVPCCLLSDALAVLEKVQRRKRGQRARAR